MTSQRQTLNIETLLLQAGYSSLVGVDEAGRGACAGPLVAAGVKIKNLGDLEWAEAVGIKDSKALRPASRLALAEQIMARLEFHIAYIEANEIDNSGLQNCNIAALRRAGQALLKANDYLLVDGFSLPGMRESALALWKGDQVSYAIAAASIVAKVHRDKLMSDAAVIYPEYGFEKHMGYSTKAHMAGVAKLGLTPIHRRSYKNLQGFI